MSYILEQRLFDKTLQLFRTHLYVSMKKWNGLKYLNIIFENFKIQSSLDIRSQNTALGEIHS